jgi:hypothetical protein
MRKAWLAISLIGVVFGASSVFAKEQSVAGTWTLTVVSRCAKPREAVNRHTA